jgi:hypothetical protein
LIPQKFIKPYPSGVAFSLRCESAFFNLTVEAHASFTITSISLDFSVRLFTLDNLVEHLMNT